MTGRAALPIIGKWRIVSSDMWDRDFPDLVEPACILFSPQGGSEFVFGAVTGSMDCSFGGLQLRRKHGFLHFDWTR